MQPVARKDEILHTIRPSRERVSFFLNEIAKIGRTEDGGVTRPSFSVEERLAHQFSATLLKEAGLEVRYDQIGNLIARRPGKFHLPPITIGSHLDTVPDGGKFDGTVGIAAGIELARTLSQSNVSLRHPLEIVVFIGEEAARFGTSTFGSRAMAGRLEQQELDALRDCNGISVAQALSGLGLDPSAIRGASRKIGEITAFLEVHVEQGPVLERSNNEIGIVTSIANSTRFLVTLHGCANHSGTTPMSERADASLAAAKAILAVRQSALEFGEGVGVATVGSVEISPGVMSAVPGKAVLGIDIRDIDSARKARMASSIRTALERIAKEEGTSHELMVLKDEAPVALDRDLIVLLEQVASRLGLSYQIMSSGAGHDAMNMAAIAPAGLIFIPSKGGISHSPLEESKVEHIIQAVRLLLNSVMRIDVQ